MPLDEDAVDRRVDEKTEPRPVVSTVDHSAMRLGRLPTRHDPRVPRMSAFLTQEVDPDSVLWGSGVADWGVMLNAAIGDCTAAAKGHFLMATTSETRKLWTPTDADVLKFYADSCGYRPGEPATDNGGVMVDVLHYLLTRGFAGRRLAAFGSVNPRDHKTLRHVVATLCGADAGLELPLSAQTQEVWGEGVADASEDKGSWGGHCVYVNGYDATHVHFVSWGKQMRMTWEFWDVYADEAYGLLFGSWIKDGKSPAGVDVATLLAYTERLRTAA